MTLAVCADVGSTYTKVAVVDLADGALVGAASHPTTVGTDVLQGLDAAVAAAARGRAIAHTYVCSSAGGGLRLAVVGYEELVTAQAGQRVALSAGGRVVHVAAGRLDAAGLRDLRAVRPDVVLLVGGTDGGDAEVVTHNATRLARARWRTPVVLAGNADAREGLTALLAGAGVPVTATGNVLPRIGVLDPAPARAAIREVFLRHVIGGKRLSRGPRFASLVRAATPDAVLTAVELLADSAGFAGSSSSASGDVLVLDIGGATTDVYSALTQGESADVAGTLWRARTVEGDLGMRWSAPGVLAAARAERLAYDPGLDAAAARRAKDPAYVAADDADDTRIAALAATVALRRHARGGRDLRGVRLVVGSGGVLRHAAPADAKAVLSAGLSDDAGGWAVPRAPRVVIDTDYVLAAGGLLAADHPKAALSLLRGHLSGR